MLRCVHLVELVDAADALISHDQRARLERVVACGGKGWVRVRVRVGGLGLGLGLGGKVVRW